jgi:hypothetical protein
MIGKLFVGLDLGQRYHQVAVINAAMKLLGDPFRIKRGRAGTEALMERIKAQGARPGRPLPGQDSHLLDQRTFARHTWTNTPGPTVST